MSPVATVMEALKLKHEQNMEVIDRLYGEIKSLRAKARSLEMQIRHGEILRGEREEEGEGEEKRGNHHRSSSGRGHRRRDGYDDDGDDDDRDGRYESDEGGEVRRRRRRDRRYDDRDGDGDDVDDDRERDRRYDDRESRRGKARRDDGDDNDSVSISSSQLYRGGGGRGGRASSSSFIISPQLQADQERYLQRLKESQRRETQQQLAQSRHETMVAQRFMRASQRDNLSGSSEFTGMRQREEEAEIRNARRKNIKEEKQRKQQEEEERRKSVQREKLALLQAKIESGEQLSWQEMEDRNRNEREARAVARREELEASAQSFEPAKGSDGVHRRLNKEKFYPDFYGPPKPFVAEEPEKVVEKLKRQQDLFLQQNQKILADQKKERREAAAKLLGASTSKTFENVTYHGTEGMVNRLIDSKQKQLTREKERAAKEQEVCVVTSYYFIAIYFDILYINTFSTCC